MNWKGAVVADFLPRAARQLGGGLHVWRESADLPEAEVSTSLFRIDGRLALLRRMVGIVTTEIEPLVTALTLVYHPDDGEVVPLGTPVDIGASPQCTLLTVPGHGDQPMVSGIMADDQDMNLLCGPGTIELQCSARATGQLCWVVTYLPLDSTSTVVADYRPPVLESPDAEAPAEVPMSESADTYAPPYGGPLRPKRD